MKYRIVIFAFSIFLMVGAATPATAQNKPDYYLSWVDCPTCPPQEAVVMFHVPDGTGSPFTRARTLNGEVDATLVLHLRDSGNNPVVDYPRENVKIEVWSGGIWTACPEGSLPDANSDDQGRVIWTNPLLVGGFCGDGDSRPVVMIKSIPLANDAFVLGNSNSPDLNGDLAVNLVDVGIFATDFFDSGNPFRSDFYFDGVVNLSDIGLLAQSIGADCP